MLKESYIFGVKDNGDVIGITIGNKTLKVLNDAIATSPFFQQIYDLKN